MFLVHLDFSPHAIGQHRRKSDTTIILRQWETSVTRRQPARDTRNRSASGGTHQPIKKTTYRSAVGAAVCTCFPPNLHGGMVPDLSRRIETTSCAVNAEGHLNARMVVEVVTTFSSFQVP
jgi:hypothetical protein